ncbi:Type II secretion system protein G precursor [Roseimaritima multifibrata]|uniref:Type II secretion system protein G n=1 Tax=Roseimaritima multifibrata TaxID=1930274 RepID=A0A517MDL8_9BACT|nr:type II secretion system protein GspG [Roseimaritima multifibrata]QDS92981.1 Type II secretion system protein G precursor [Roseimaritima multifibrata]
MNRRIQTSRMSRKSRPSGFTLLELLLVLAILVVLGGFVLTNFIGVGENANADATTVQLNSLKSNIQMYKINTKSWPESLEQLRDGPTDPAQKARFQPILSEIPADAWGKEINYTLNGNTFELRSGGIDGQMNSDDDLIVKGP